MDRTQRLARRNAKKEEAQSPRADRLAKFRDKRARGLRDDIFLKHHKDSYIHYIYLALNAVYGNSLSRKWSDNAGKKFPKENRFKYNGEDWWITCHGFIAKDDGLVKGWVHADGVEWIKTFPDKLKCFVWI